MILAPALPRLAAACLRRALGLGCLALATARLSPTRAGEFTGPEPARLTLGSGAVPMAPWWAGEWLSVLENPAPTVPDPASPAVRRARLAEMVKNGRLAGRIDTPGAEERTVSFRPLRRTDPTGANPLRPSPPPEPVKELGPLEDAALAAAVRGRIAADPVLGRLGVSVASEAGRVTLRTVTPRNPPGLDHTAALLSLALGVDEVVEVSTDLPAATGN